MVCSDSTISPQAATTHRRRRGDRGLTTLEWLLIVAAVAGLAALAVVLVQNVVDDTAEQISGSSARLTAALVAAQEITDGCETTNGASIGCTDGTATAASRTDAQAKCNRLSITYGDALQNATPSAEVMWFTAVASNKVFGDATFTAAANTCRLVNA